jgi:ATP-binding protein involved in chromosome partitioning
MTTVTEAAVLDALRMVRDPDFNRDIVDLQYVKNVRIDGGRVMFTIELFTPASGARETIRTLARDLVARLPGVTDVDVAMAASVRPAVSPDINKPPVAGVKNVIAVGAGKGGVGKTTVAVNLAIALSQAGARVAMIDGDVYGPNVPIMLGISTQLQTESSRRNSTGSSSCRWRF